MLNSIGYGYLYSNPLFELGVNIGVVILLQLPACSVTDLKPIHILSTLGSVFLLFVLIVSINISINH